MLNATDDDRQAIVDYLASQAHDENVSFLQKVYSERLHGTTHDIWDVHTDKDRWWVITNPTNLYLQSQFPNMDLALTFHVGLSVRIPRSERTDIRDLNAEPLLAAWRALEQAREAILTAQEIEDYQAVGVRCRECLLRIIHAMQHLVVAPDGSDLKASDFIGWSEVVADVSLAGGSQKARRRLLKSSARECWEFVNWLTHATDSHYNDVEAALEATDQALGLFTTACIRYVRAVPDSCPSCGSQRLAPERGSRSTEPDRIYERPVCGACGWRGKPLEIAAEPAARARKPRRKPPDGECSIMSVPLQGVQPPRPTWMRNVPSNKPLQRTEPPQRDRSRIARPSRRRPRR
jgi:hypothetical protein